MHHHALELFISTVSEHRHWGYVVLFLGMIVEGEFILMAAGVLAQIGALNLGITFLAAYVGVLTNNIFWYGIGAYLKKKHTHRKFIQWIENRNTRFLASTKEKPLKAMFISKFITGIGHPTLILLGFLKIDLKYFLKAQALISFLWTLIFLALGFLFGYAAISFSHRLNKFLLIAFILIISVLIMNRILRRFIGSNRSKGL